VSITIHDEKNKKSYEKMKHHRQVQFWPEVEKLPKPDWLKIKVSQNDSIIHLKQVLRSNQLVTVCEEASCPNLIECFGKGVATFMIMGDKCTRRCSFCDVQHGKPDPLDIDEPKRLAKTISEMKLQYVVITSVDRDDLVDGGAAHFSSCIKEARSLLPELKIEILVPDFRKRQEIALNTLGQFLPDVFNHNMETVKRLYKPVRPGSDYDCSLNLIKKFKELYPDIPTKSGIMLGLGETLDEVIELMKDLVDHGCDWLTVGQYLQPSPQHYPVMRYVSPDEFKFIEKKAYELGFKNVASGPFVRSSYHADTFAHVGQV
jgi:lipoyl synthase